ncbi:MAG: hypothetical protein F9K46_16655 [Anaerolineae bacterium]|nr:MAG: hypothetical protein F9K46_16655 [Anaerolineae bacterium]
MFRVLKKFKEALKAHEHDPWARVNALQARLETTKYWLEITGEKTDGYKSALASLIKKCDVYAPYQLLPIETVEDFGKDLEKIGIVFYGFDGWEAVKFAPPDCEEFREQAKTSKYNRGPMVKYEPDGSCYHLAETLYSFGVGENILFGENPVRESIQAINDCIANHLPDPQIAHIVYVAIDLLVPLSWDDEIYGR